jgi:hypothetical protein
MEWNGISCWDSGLLCLGEKIGTNGVFIFFSSLKRDFKQSSRYHILKLQFSLICGDF